MRHFTVGCGMADRLAKRNRAGRSVKPRDGLRITKKEMEQSMNKMIAVVAGILAVAVIARADDDLVAKGKKLVEDSKPKCQMCHQVDGKGGKLSKPMDQLAADHPDDFLKGALLDPKKTIKADTKMPAYKFSDDEAAAVVAYIKSLKK